MKKKLEIIRYDFWTGAREENLVVNNKDNIECLCLETIGLIVTPWKYDVLKASLFPRFNYQPIVPRQKNFII